MNKTSHKVSYLTTMLAGLLLTGCQSIDANNADKKALSEQQVVNTNSAVEQLPSVDEILIQNHDCSPTITIRSQALTEQQIQAGCELLIAQEAYFHQVFNTRGKPVADDNNASLRANFYHTRADYVKYASQHFNMPTDNGGMYLEGLPDRKDNHAEFVAYERNGGLWNLEHEYVHYLDGRFNQYGDYCNGLHDDHSGPEFCPQPHLAYPHMAWWGEGLGEYLAKRDVNPEAIKLAASKQYPLSALFNTSYNHNGGTDRVYRWGYLAVRFMMENHRDKIEEMLILTRQGDWQGYQKLVRTWSTQFDEQWYQWLDKLVATANK